jgi:hypothetical protein
MNDCVSTGNQTITKDTSAFSASARWIWSDAPAMESWWMFRKRFSTAGMKVREARLKITSNLHHLTYINGKIVQRGPGVSFPFAKFYSVLDITPYLVPDADNVIAVLSIELGHPGIFEVNTETRGLLAEIDLTADTGEVQTLSSNADWRVREHRSFKKDTPRSCLLPCIDESFDARLEEVGWTLPGYDDSTWNLAHELEPASMPPRAGMMQNPTGLQSDDPVYPVGFSAIELARPSEGYHFRLGPASDGLMIYVTEVTAPADTTVKLRGVPRPSLDGQAIQGSDLVIPKGTHLLTLCNLSYGSGQPEFFFETAQRLTFSAAALLGDHAAPWAYMCLPAKTVKYPWHETAANVMDTVPELPIIMALPSMKDIGEKYPAAFKPAMILENSTLHHAQTRQYLKVAGGFTDLLIDRGQPRAQSGAAYQKPLKNEHCLLHANADACTILPQPGMDVHFIVDFDKLVLGHLCLELDAPAGAVVDVQCAEMIDGGGLSTMPTYNTLRYVCREGRQRFLSHLRRGFRYASVTVQNFSRPIQFHRLYCYHTAYPVQTIGKFECSDELLNRIYKLSADTAALCMLDTYVDCSGHEQNFWVGDARITAIINLLTYGAYGLNQHHIRIVGQSLRPEWVKTYWPNDERYTSGHYMPIAGFPNYPEGSLPMWTFLWMMQCWEHYLYGANLTDLEENFGYMAETIRHCRLLTNERGLFDMPGAWNLIEWANNDLSPYGEVTANNVLLVQSLRLTAKMAKILGRTEQALEYEREAQSRMDAINRHCWDENRQAYVDTVRDRWAFDRYLKFCETQGMTPLSFEKYLSCTRISEQTNTLALLSDCVPAGRVANVIKIVRRVRIGGAGAPFSRSYGPPTDKEAPDGIVAIGSPFFLFFSLEALFKMGEAKAALDVIRSGWAVMVESGTKGCWETFKYNDRNWTRSISHAWSAAPAVYLPTEVLGIKPVEPGYRKFTIKPKTEGLTWARGAVATPFGPIQVRWNRTGEGPLNIDFSAPQNCERVE